MPKFIHVARCSLEHMALTHPDVPAKPMRWNSGMKEKIEKKREEETGRLY